MKASRVGGWVVAGMLVSGSAYANSAADKIIKACDTSKDGKISKEELVESKCQSKVVNVLAVRKRALTVWQASSAKAILDGELSADKKAIRAERITCATTIAKDVYKSKGLQDWTPAQYEDVFKKCFPALFSSSARAKINAKIDKLIKKITDSQAVVESLIASIDEDALAALQLRVDAQQTLVNATFKIAVDVTKGAVKLGTSIAVGDPMNTIKGAVKFLVVVGGAVLDAKEARSIACQYALEAEKLEPSKWHQGFVKSCAASAAAKITPDSALAAE